jgi:hypothetical protein
MTWSNFTWKGLLVWLLAGFFLIGALGNIFASGEISADYARWGYPDWFHYLTGLLELSCAILLVAKPLRFWGALLSVAVMLAAAGTVALHGEYAHAIAPAVVLGLSAVVVWTHKP